MEKEIKELREKLTSIALKELIAKTPEIKKLRERLTGIALKSLLDKPKNVVQEESWDIAKLAVLYADAVILELLETEERLKCFNEGDTTTIPKLATLYADCTLADLKQTKNRVEYTLSDEMPQN